MAYFKDSTQHLGALVLHYHFIQLRYHLEETPPKSLMEDLLTWNSQETSETARNFGRGGEGARGGAARYIHVFSTIHDKGLRDKT